MADHPYPNPRGGGGAAVEAQGHEAEKGRLSDDDKDNEHQEREEVTEGEDELWGDDEEAGMDYYAILNVPRDATNAQLRQSYRHLSLLFHPDKQPPERREQATSRFNLIQKAYEILNDPRKRIVYDTLGEEGLRMGSMELGHSAMSPEEFRYYIEEKIRHARTEALERELGFHATFVAGLDGRRWFGLEQEYIRTPDGGLIPAPESRPLLRRIYVQQGFHFQIRWLRGWLNHPMSINGVFEGVGNFLPGVAIRKKSDWELDEELERDKAIERLPAPLLRFHTSVGGRTVDAMTQDASGRQKRIASGLLWSQAGMDVSLVHSFPALPPQPPRKQGDKSTGWMDKETSIARVLADSQVTLTHQIMHKTSTLAYARPILGRTVSLNMSAKMHHATGRISMPILEASLSRAITRRGTFFISFGSGGEWGLNLPFGLGRWGGAGEWWGTAGSSIGYTYRGGNGAAAQMDDDDDGGDIDATEEEATGGQGNDSGKPNGNANGNDKNSRKKTSPKPRTNPNTIATMYMSANRIIPSVCVLTVGLDLSRTFLALPRPKNLPRSVPLPNSYRGIRAQLKSSVNLLGTVSTSVSFTRPVATKCRIGLSFSIDPSEPGVVLGLVFRRLGQKIQIPILATRLISAEDLVYRGFNVWGFGVVSIAVGWWVWETGVVRTWEKRQRKLSMVRRMRGSQDRVEKYKRQAQEAVALMLESVERKLQREREHDGLVVVEATYGLPEEKGFINYLGLREKMKEGEELRRIDVTIPVASLVDNAQLVIPRNTSISQLVGFYDPFPGSIKTLKIRYLFRGILHEVEVQGRKGIVCPNRGHVVPKEKN